LTLLKLRKAQSHCEPKPAEIAPNFNDYSRKILSNGRLKTERPLEFRERAMWRDFSRAVVELWRTSGEPCSSYRPDLHYMRGPGPKWHAKYDSLYQQTARDDASETTDLVAAERHA
jgi:hypothetical protein